jgi:uncharacterized protein (DUF2164 family)
MIENKRNWSLLTEKQRRETIDEIIDFFKNERGEEIGIIAAETLLDHFLQTIGIQLYNKGIDESIYFLKDRIDSVAIDMDSLLKKK